MRSTVTLETDRRLDALTVQVLSRTVLQELIEAEAVEHFRDRQVRGEIVVVVEGNPGEHGDPEEEAESARAMAEALLAQGVAPSSVAKELRRRLHISRNDAYQLVQELAAE